MKKRIVRKPAGENRRRKRTTRQVSRAKARTRGPVKSKPIRRQKTKRTRPGFYEEHFSKVAIPIALASALVLG